MPESMEVCMRWRALLTSVGHAKPGKSNFKLSDKMIFARPFLNVCESIYCSHAWHKDGSAWSQFSLPIKHVTNFVTSLCIYVRHYILPTKTTSIERDWNWILNNLKVVTEDSRKMYGWYARTTEHPNTRSDVLTTEPPGQGSSVSEVGILLYQ